MYRDVRFYVSILQRYKVSNNYRAVYWVVAIPCLGSACEYLVADKEY